MEREEAPRPLPPQRSSVSVWESRKSLRHWHSGRYRRTGPNVAVPVPTPRPHLAIATTITTLSTLRDDRNDGV